MLYTENSKYFKLMYMHFVLMLYLLMYVAHCNRNA